MFKRSAIQSPEHWSKDFVEHLRTVHFALVTVSVGLILLLTSKPYDVRKASAEINSILVMKKSLSQRYSTPRVDDTLIRGPVLKSAKERGEYEDSAYSFLATPDADAIRADSTLRNQTFAFHIAEPNTAGCGVFYEDFQTERFPSTEGKFQFWWDSFRRDESLALSVDSVWLVSPVGSILTASRKPIGQVFITTVRGVPKDGTQLRLSGRCDSSETNAATIEGSSKSYEFRFPVIVYKDDIKPERFSTRGGPWTFRPFAEEFEDLARAAQSREDMPLEAFATELANEASKSAESFEAFGFKFSGAQVTSWGIVLLVCVQLYFVMYLKRLSHKLMSNDPGWDVPWVAMDQSLMARIMLAASVVVIPCVAAAFVIIRAELPWFSWGFTWHVYAVFRSLDMPNRFQFILLPRGVCVRFALSALAWHYRPQLSEPVAPSQLFE